MIKAKNEELARPVMELEKDHEELRKEFEQRLGSAERKIYALTKERDALKRGSVKLMSANELLKEKDDIIQQVRRSNWPLFMPDCALVSASESIDRW